MKVLERLERICNQGIEMRLFPGAAFAVGDSGSFDSSYIGFTTYSSRGARELNYNSLFDLASLTKPLCTSRLVRIAVEEGLLELESASQFSDEVTLRELLAHTSGLPPYFDFHLHEPIPNNIVEMILATKPDPELQGTVVYSCLGFIWLQHWLEVLYGETLDSLYRRFVAIPFGLSSSGFLPLTWTEDPENIVPTTEIETWRRPSLPSECEWNGLLRGAVHDPIAYQMGGVSGNSGLFSSLNDVAALARLDLISARLEGDHSIWTSEQATGRALGWATWSPDCSAGNYFSRGSFGHTGYTGTSVWIDPIQNLFAVLLTNRIHPNDSVNLLEFRRVFHDEIFAA